jgi:Ca-activated chloride channel homolog
MLSMILFDLTFLRPWWFAALAPSIIVLFVFWRTHTGTQAWREVADAQLLPALIDTDAPSSSKPAFALMVVLMLLVVTALAGPSLSIEPAPAYRGLDGQVFVLDLSPSMNAIDVAPNRLDVAKAAIITRLRESHDQQLGLVVFGADAFVAVPVTRDAATLVHLLHDITTRVLPRPGSRPDLGLLAARQLLESSTVGRGSVVLVGDS